MASHLAGMRGPCSPVTSPMSLVHMGISTARGRVAPLFDRGCPRPEQPSRSSFRMMPADMGRLVLSFRSTTHHSVQTTATAGSVPATYEEDQ